MPIPGAIASKIDRAHAHLTDLQPKVDRLVKDCTDALARYDEPERSEYSFRLDAVPRTPIILSNIFGDALHNLRSALDYIANDSVVHHGIKSRIPTTSTEFDIMTTPPAAKRHGKPGLPNFSPKVDKSVRVVYDAVQPYKLDPGPWRDHHPLVMLHALNIIDKHRQLLVAIIGTRWAKWGNDGSITMLNFNTGPYNDGDEVCRFRITNPDTAANFKPNIIFHVRLDEPDAGPFGRDQPLTKVGELLEWAVRAVATAFDPMFPQGAHCPTAGLAATRRLTNVPGIYT